MPTVTRTEPGLYAVPWRPYDTCALVLHDWLGIFGGQSNMQPLSTVVRKQSRLAEKLRRETRQSKQSQILNRQGAEWHLASNPVGGS